MPQRTSRAYRRARFIEPRGDPKISYKTVFKNSTKNKRNRELQGHPKWNRNGTKLRQKGSKIDSRNRSQKQGRKRCILHPPKHRKTSERTRRGGVVGFRPKGWVHAVRHRVAVGNTPVTPRFGIAKNVTDGAHTTPSEFPGKYFLHFGRYGQAHLGVAPSKTASTCEPIRPKRKTEPSSSRSTTGVMPSVS